MIIAGMKPADVVAYFGTQVKTAEALNMTQGSVSSWFRRGAVPPLRQIQIERVTGGALKADPTSVPWGRDADIQAVA